MKPTPEQRAAREGKRLADYVRMYFESQERPIPDPIAVAYRDFLEAWDEMKTRAKVKTPTKPKRYRMLRAWESIRIGVQFFSEANRWRRVRAYCGFRLRPMDVGLFRREIKPKR